MTKKCLVVTCFPAIAALLIAGCSDGTAAVDEVPLGTRLEAGLAAALESQVSPVCADGTSPDEILAVNLRVCLTCVNVGWLVRRRIEDIGRGRVALAAPAQEVDAVCNYLKREKAVVPVIPIKLVPDLADYPESEEIFAFQLRSKGGPRFLASAGYAYLLNRRISEMEGVGE